MTDATTDTTATSDTKTSDTKDAAQDLAERAEDSRGVQHVARLGLAARTLVWLVVGLLAASVALGGDQQADQGGALRTLSESPLGGVLLVALALGFLCYAGYRLLCLAVGHRDDPDSRKRWAHRAKSGGEALVFVAAAVSVVRVLAGGGGDSEQETTSATATLMELPAGRTMVGLVGVTALVVGLVLVVRALAHAHDDKLEWRRLSPRWWRPAMWLGAVGLTGRGLVVALLGGFLVNAAVRFDPQQAKGLDAALQALAGQPFGTGLLVLAAVGLLGYALWSLAETVYGDL